MMCMSILDSWVDCRQVGIETCHGGRGVRFGARKREKSQYVCEVTVCTIVKGSRYAPLSQPSRKSYTPKRIPILAVVHRSKSSVH
jgi:hypothetical protein